MTDTPDLLARRRPFAPVHRRSVELQQLDALHRMEELMQKLVDAGGVRVQDEIQIEADAIKAPVRRGRK